MDITYCLYIGSPIAFCLFCVLFFCKEPGTASRRRGILGPDGPTYTLFVITDCSIET